MLLRPLHSDKQVHGSLSSSSVPPFSSMNISLPGRRKQSEPTPPTALQSSAPKPTHHRNLTSPSLSAESATSLDRPTIRHFTSDTQSPTPGLPRVYQSSSASQSQGHLSPQFPPQSSGTQAPPAAAELYALRNSSQFARLQDKLYRPGAEEFSSPTSAKPPGSNRRLRKSTSFLLGSSSTIMNNQNLRQIDKPLVSPRNRLSDDSSSSQKPARKKTGISQFVKGVLGSPRKPEISLPEHPVHLTHVGYDTSTGEFTVSDDQIRASRAS